MGRESGGSCFLQSALRGTPGHGWEGAPQASGCSLAPPHSQEAVKDYDAGVLAPWCCQAPGVCEALDSTAFPEELRPGELDKAMCPAGVITASLRWHQPQLT